MNVSPQRSKYGAAVASSQKREQPGSATNRCSRWESPIAKPSRPLCSIGLTAHAVIGAFRICDPQARRLLGSEHMPQQRSAYVTLPFHRSGGDARKALFAGDEDGARRAFGNLVREVSVLPDITTEHRYRLMQGYRTDFECEPDWPTRSFWGQGAARAA